MKALRWTALALAMALLAATVFATWLVTSASGARFALKFAASRIPGKLAVGDVEGSLAGPLVLTHVEYQAPRGQPPVTLGRIEVDVALKELLQRRLHVVRASLADVRIELPPPSTKQPGLPPIPLLPASLPPLQPRWPVQVDELTASSVIVERGGERLLTVDRAQAAGRWTDGEIAVERMDVSGRDGVAALSGRLTLAAAPQLEALGKLRWTIRSVTYAGELKARTEDGRMVVDAGFVAPFAGTMRAELSSAAPANWTVAVEVPEFDPRGAVLPPTSKLERLGVELRGEGSHDGARIAGDVRVNGERLRLEQLHASVASDALRIHSLVARISEGEGSFEARGEIRAAAEGPKYSLAVQARELVLPAAWVRQPLLADGEFRVSGTTLSYAADGALTLGPPGRPSQVEFSLRGDRERLQLEPLRVVQPDGSLEARGDVRFVPLRWDLAGTARDFNPGEFFPDWSGRLRGEVSSRGEIAADGPRFAVNVQGLSGQLRDRPITGEGSLTFAPSDWLEGELHLESGETRVRIRSTKSEVPEAHIDLVLPAAQDWIPGAAGELRVAAVMRGKWPAVGISGEAGGRALKFGAFEVGRMDLKADVADIRSPGGSLRGSLEHARAGALAIASLRLEGSGDEAAHELRLVAEGRPLRTRLQLTGRMAERKWEGTIRELQFGWSDLPALTLQAPAQVSIGRDGAVDLSRAAFAGGDIRFDLAAARTQTDEFSGEVALENLPLSLLESLVPGAMPVRVEGLVSAQGRLHRAAAGPWSGEGSLSSPRAQVVMSGDKSADLGQLLMYENLSIEASTDGRDGRAKVTAGLTAQGRLAAELAFTGLDRRDPQVEGSIEASFPTLEPVAAFVPQLPGIEGKAEAKLRVSGRVTAPAVAGHFEASSLQAEVPRLGLRLREGTLRIEPGSGRELRIAGGITSGDGQLRLEGAWTPGGAGQATLKGDRLLAADLPSARVVVAPDVTLTYDAAGLMVKGRAGISEAAVNLQQLPQGRRQSRSRDVVVVDRPQEDARQRLAPLSAELAVELGDKVRVTGYGLDAQLRGRVTVFEKPGTPTTGAGEVLAEGTYQGYGQDLKITRGRVLYAGTPIDDPRLDISAERELEEITAGVRITGTAQAPEVNVFSRPDMGQADALSYLVTGKPLSGVASEGESDLLDSAARSLGTAAGSLLAERIGHRLGIDEVGIEDSDMIEGGVFTIGEYLSPRLYVAYGVGLFEPGDLVTLRYELTKALNLRAVRGPDETRAGVEYRIER